MSGRPRILAPLTSAASGGSQLSLLTLADALRDAFEFTVWTFEDGPMVARFTEQGIDCRLLQDARPHTPWGFCRFESMLQEENPDLIYLHATRLIAWIARGLRIPCVERINMTRRAEAGGWCNRLPWLDRIMTNWNTNVIAVSDAIRRQLLARGVADEKITVLRNFVDGERFADRTKRKAIRETLTIPADATVLLNLGRMVPQKAQTDFLNVAARCIEANPTIHALLVGEGPLHKALSREADRLGLTQTGRFRTLPFQNDVVEILAASDILIHTAHWEPLANVLLEAMAAGLAIIATDVDGTAEALDEYGPATRIGVGQTEAMAEAILTCDTSVRGTLPPMFEKTRGIERYRDFFYSIIKSSNSSSRNEKESA